jgi:hypothetical protein
MDQPDRDPIDLERQAIAVAAHAAGISPSQALTAIDAAAPLIRRASVIRNLSVISAYYKDWPDDHPGKIEVMKVVDRLLRAVDTAESVEPQ